MPYRAIATQRFSACGDTYIHVDVVFTPDNILTDQELGDEIGKYIVENSFQNDDTFGNSAPDEMASDDAYWDTIPF